MGDFDYQKYVTMAIDWAVLTLPGLIVAAITLWVGLWVIKRLNRVVTLSLEKANISKEIAPILASIANIGMKGVLFFVVAGMVGFDTASFVAMLAAAGFAIGLALQGSLGNFAAGLLIIFFKPYKVGDLIEVEGKFGEVHEVQIFSTTLITPGKKKLIVPNGKIIDGVVINYSSLGVTRMELSILLPYEIDFPQVEKVISDAVKLTPGVLTDPAPEFGIEAFESTGIRIAIRPFVKPNDYWTAKFELHKHVKRALHLNNIPVAVTDDAGPREVGA
jgi:small conductance mechanosensitive channel